MTTEGWPDDRVTGAADLPSIVRHCAGPVDDEDRYEILGAADGTDEGWHVLDRDASTGDALFTLVTLRPQPRAGQDHDEHLAEQEMWRARAAGLTRVRHDRLAGVVATFRGPGPHAPGRAVVDGPLWSYAVLEQASGRSVADWLRDDPGAPVQERLTVLATAAAVLQELHRGSDHVPPLVHGDISPRTLRLGGFWPADGVRLAGASLGGLRRGPLHGDRSSACTAPEVRAGGLPSAASDVFGFGVTAIVLLTGNPVAVGDDGALDLALVRRQLGAAPFTAPHRGMADLLLQAVATDPHERPDRLPVWVNALRAFVAPVPATEAVSFVAVGRPDADDPLAPGTRRLPRRPVAVVAGALILATAGVGVAIAAVQQGRLKDVPNPVAIVMPAPVTAPTDALQVPSTQQSRASADEGVGQADGTPSPRTRRQGTGSSSARGVTPSGPPTSSVGGSTASTPPGVVVPGGGLGSSPPDAPTVPPLIPPLVSDPSPTSSGPEPSSAPPPATSPPAASPPAASSPPVTSSPPAPPSSPEPSSPPPSSPPGSSSPPPVDPTSSPDPSSPPASSTPSPTSTDPSFPPALP